MTKARRPRYLDEIDEALRTDLDGLVAEYRNIAAANGVSARQLRDWLSNETLMDYVETAKMYGVAVATLREWVKDANAAGRNRQYEASYFITFDVSKGSRIRLWRFNRALVHGWRSGKIQPGTLIPRRQKPTGPPRRARAAA